MKRILMVLTSVGEKGTTGVKTGYYMSEATHPWKVFVEADYDVDFVSPLGGESPIDTFDLSDPINCEFWQSDVWRSRICHAMRPADVDYSRYCAVFFVGGHGAMWDLPTDERISDIAVCIYEQGGVIGGVCHGPAGIVNLRLTNGEYLVSGKRVNSFTDEEERIEGTAAVVPFLLESRLRDHGACFEKSAPWHVHCVSDQRLVTGQNPMSALIVAREVVAALQG